MISFTHCVKGWLMDLRRHPASICILVLAAVALALIAGCGTSTENPTTVQLDSAGATAELMEGNARYVKGSKTEFDTSAETREALVSGQEPFAVIVGCTDSRVPPNLLFDQGLGEIFVVRVAGNVVDPVVLGSVEYAVEHLHSPLIVVLGHTKCGAVTAAVEGGEQPGDIDAVIALIQPSVQQARALGLTGDAEIGKATELNIEASVTAIEASPVVSHLVKEGKLDVIGAEYDLSTGAVQWLGQGMQ